MAKPAITFSVVLVLALLKPFGVVRCEAALDDAQNEASLTIRSRKLGRELKLDGLFYETSAGRARLPRELTATNTSHFRRRAKMDDGRVVTVSLGLAGANHFNIRLSAEPDSDIVKCLYGPDLLVSPIWEKGKREQEVYLPRGSRWRDVWRRGKIYDGGKTITIHAELYQIPMFIREGSVITPGDLHQEYRESLAIAQKKPDLSKLDAAVREWFEHNKQ